MVQLASKGGIKVLHQSCASCRVMSARWDGAGRSETMIEYDIGFDTRGKVRALRVRGYFLCGAHMDLGFNDMMVLQTGVDQATAPLPIPFSLLLHVCAPWCTMWLHQPALAPWIHMPI